MTNTNAYAFAAAAALTTMGCGAEQMPARAPVSETVAVDAYRRVEATCRVNNDAKAPAPASLLTLASAGDMPPGAKRISSDSWLSVELRKGSKDITVHSQEGETLNAFDFCVFVSEHSFVGVNAAGRAVVAKGEAIPLMAHLERPVMEHVDLAGLFSSKISGARILSLETNPEWRGTPTGGAREQTGKVSLHSNQGSMDLYEAMYEGGQTQAKFTLSLTR